MRQSPVRGRRGAAGAGDGLQLLDLRRKGYLHHFTTPDRFRFDGSRDDLQVYQFGKHAIRHQFCRTCGAAPFAEGTGPDGKPMVEINLRCAEIELSALEIIPYDGASR